MQPRPHAPSSLTFADPQTMVNGLAAVFAPPLPLRAMPAATVEGSPDVDDAVLETTEIRVLWGSNVLHVAHLAASRSFYVGDPAEGRCDFTVDRGPLGAGRMPIVLARGTSHALVVPAGASLEIVLPGGALSTGNELISTGMLSRSAEASGAHEMELPFGAKARIRLASTELAFEVEVVRAARPVSKGVLATFDASAHAYTGLSAVMHMALVASLAFFLPSMNADAAEEVDRDAIVRMQAMLNTIAERETEHVEEAANVLNAADERSGGSGERAAGEEGAAGTQVSKNTSARYGTEGPHDNTDPHLARERAMNEMRTESMLGILARDAAGDARAPIAAWARDESLGNDPKSAMGNMWGRAIDDAFGSGLGLAGVGEGGGCEHGSCAGIGMDHIGGLSHGVGGTLDGQGIGPGGWGHSSGHLGGTHAAKALPIHEGVLDVGGRLAPEVIQRVVRQNFGRFRLCYEQGMRTNPSLEGRVAVKFVIDRRGEVSLASDAGSTLPDQGVISCVVRAFTNLSFPEPKEGVVKVVYPIILSPSE